MRTPVGGPQVVPPRVCGLSAPALHPALCPAALPARTAAALGRQQRRGRRPLTHLPPRPPQQTARKSSSLGLKKKSKLLAAAAKSPARLATRGTPASAAKKGPAKKVKAVRKAVHVPTKPRVKRHHKKGALALKEIRKFQKSTELLVPRAPFMRLMREVAQSATENKDLRFKVTAIDAMQEAAEAYLVRRGGA